MIIQSSNVTSSAGRRYQTQQAKNVSSSAWNNQTGAMTSSFISNRQQYTEITGSYKGIFDQAQNRQQNLLSDPMGEYQSLQRVSSNDTLTQISDIHRLKQKVLDYLLSILLGKEYTKTDNSVSITNAEESFQALGEGSSQSVAYFYQESEMTHFETTGTAVTADGREISFNIDLTMSRSYMEMSGTQVQLGQPYLCDPLVINLNGNGTTVTDQRFLFDIDGDGNSESISKLGAGNGYLALDLNEDGTINDGNELFGTQSGNGFADLAKYDKDGNGWIDEADEIFSKLKVWTIDENGVSSLISLKEANVGAIYLGSEDTKFSLTNQNNEVNALVRRTGMFLYETGMAGTIQQVDLAISDPA